MDRCRDCFIENQQADEDRKQKIRDNERKLKQEPLEKRSAADAAAAPPLKRRRTIEPKEKPKPKQFPPVPKWKEKKSAQGPPEVPMARKPFEGDGDQILNVRKWGRIKQDLSKSDLPQRILMTEYVTYAKLRKDQPVYCCDKSGDGWSCIRFLPE